jgi:hypothetical protein
MATVGITFGLKVHGGVTIQGYLDNTLLVHRQALGVNSFTVERLDQSRIGEDNWYQARVRITPHGLGQNLQSFTLQLEALLCADPNIVVLDRGSP